jgi:glycosyltransferase involved in cell wall biosynthesis
LPYPLTSGGAQAQYNMIDVLRKKHHITVVFPLNGHNHRSALQQLQARWPEVEFRPYSYLRQLSCLPFLFSKIRRSLDLLFRRRSVRFQVERALVPYGYIINTGFVQFVRTVITQQHADVVQVEFYPYLSLVKHLPHSVRKIFIHHEIRYVRNARILDNLSSTDRERAYMEQLKSEELSLLNLYDEVVTLTAVDKRILEHDGVTVPITVSPAAVDSPVLPYKGWNSTLVFLGGKGHGPNVEGMNWLTGEVLPLIDWEETFCETTLKVIGAGWSETDITGIPKKNIAVKGFVPQLKDEAYGGIMIVPILSGSGMRMKILEASALCMPIVTTSVGVEGINLVDGVSCIVADTAPRFAAALMKLMTDESLRKRLAEEAQRVFVSSYSKEALADKREEMYKTKKQP